MDLEASVIKRLEELQQWQIEQQQRLFRQQEVEWQKLSSEQKQMCKALGIPVEQLLDAENISSYRLTPDPRDNNIDDNDANTDSSESYTDSDNSQNLSVISKDERQLRMDKSTETFQEPVNTRELNSPNVHMEESNQLEYSDGGDELIAVTPKKCRNPLLKEVLSLSSVGADKSIDEIQVPSPKKDFLTMLEEKLKDAEAQNMEKAAVIKSKNPIKRPFLKKGEGLRRYGMYIKTDGNTSTKKFKFQSTKVPSRTKENKCQKVIAISNVPKLKVNTIIKRNNKVSRKMSPNSKLPLKKLNLKNVPLPQNSKLRSKCSLTHIIKPPEVVSEIHESYDENLDTSKRETEMFELLEQKAENSSFCSTSSAVLAFKQQSTPLKLKSIRKNLQTQKNSKDANNIINDDLNILVKSLASNKLHELPLLQPIQKKLSPINMLTSNEESKFSENDSENRMNEMNTQKNTRTISTSKKIYCNDNLVSGNLQQNQQTRMLQQYSLDNIDASSTTETESDLSECDDLKDNDHHEADVSVHVRFSEYNEYKTLTDTSSISRDSYNYSDRNWSDHSASTESSDVEIETRPVVNSGTSNELGKINQNSSNYTTEYYEQDKISPHYEDVKSTENSDEASDTQDSDDEHTFLNDSDDNIENTNTVIEFGESMTQILNWDKRQNEVKSQKIITTAQEEIVNEGNGQLNVLNDINGTILKSELLKNRLLDLEREIDIFRKENSTLTVERQKIRELQNKLQKEFKNKDENLRREKNQMESALQEEKKRLAREKAALENRLRDAREKSLQAKQERQEIEILHENFNELREEMNEKENRWQAAQARQRSQIRVLQIENVKLKQEIERLNSLKKGTTKFKKSHIPSNTKSIHEINKQLDNQRKYLNAICTDERDKVAKKEEKSKPSQDIRTNKAANTNISNNPKVTGNTVEDIVHKSPKAKTNQENSAQKRYLYEGLLKDARNEYETYFNSEESNEADNESVKNKTDTLPTQKSPIQGHVANSVVPKKNEIIENYRYSTQNRFKFNEKYPHNVQLDNNGDSKVIQKSYKQFVQDVINTKNDEKRFIDTNTNNNSPQRRDVGQEPSVQSYSPKSNGILAYRSQIPGTTDLRTKTGDKIGKEFVKSNHPGEPVNYGISSNNLHDSDLNPRRERLKPLKLLNENISSQPESSQIHQMPQSPIQKGAVTSIADFREVKHPDGHTEYWYPNGNVKRVYPDSNISKMIYYNGDVRETTADGCVKYFYAATKTWQTTYSDGFEILEFPDGQQERRTPDGVVEVSFPDGTIRLMQPDGVEKWAMPDGTIAEIFPNGEKILSFSNGQREIHTLDHKRREYPDGTVKFVYPDGTQETRYSNGRIRMKDIDGNLIMDSHQD